MDSLRQAIESFDIDGGKLRLSFDKRLARENGWTVRFSNRVINEYKRFVYLAMVAGHPVTPSEHVDQAWHLHLTYTKSYWQRLNQEILPRPLHHNPTEGGDKEDSKFDDWYAKTLASYEKIFGEKAPSDIWPPSEQRFGKDLQWLRVNVADNWVIPKKRALVPLLGGLIAILAGCVPLLADTTIGASIWIWPVLIFAGVAIIFAMFAAAARGGQRRNDGSGGSGCGTGSSHTSSDNDGCGDGGSDGGGGCGGGGCGGGCGG